MEVVGVVQDVKFGGPSANSVQMVYVPILQSPMPDGALAVRTAGDPMSIARTVRSALAQIGPDTPVAEVRTMDQIVAQSMARPRTETWLMAVFAMIALALAGLEITASCPTPWRRARTIWAFAWPSEQRRRTF